MSNLFKFRRYKKIEGGKKKGKHPKLIVDEKDGEYGFVGLTSSPKRGHHNNVELENNPQKGNNKKSYIRDELRYDKKKYFSEILKNYDKLTNRDIEKILKLISKHKKKK